MLRGCVAALVLAATAAPAHGYEFWVRSRTIGQAYQLRAYRLIGPDLFLDRRRYTETLALRIWDIGGLAAARRRARQREHGLRISWQSYLRVQHDFGDYANAQLSIVDDRVDALDVIPELSESLISLDLMYGYLELAGIADDRVTLQLGRVVFDDGWGPAAVDGVTARIELPPPLAISASAGLRVRATSPLGISAYELDGTSGAACREYVEAATPGTGSWKLIDRSRVITGARFTSDLEFCPQRDQLQPTIAVALATSRLRHFGAELGYRRTWSSTVGLIGAVDRLDFPDQGLYPNEDGQAPGHGVNEEHLHARVHGELTRGGVAIRPYGAARLSLLHAALDRVDAGVELARGAHALEPGVGYFLPTFDGDSIFNAFAAEPASDARLEYRYDGAVRARVRGWLRRYAPIGDDPAYAGGVEGGVERALGPRWRARADALWDDGYGGRRIGGTVEAAWRARPTMWVRGRAVVLGVAPDDDTPRYVTGAGVASTTWQLGDAAALHAIAELDRDALHGTLVRVVAVLDLAFAPEP